MALTQKQIEEGDWSYSNDDMDASDWEYLLGGPEDDAIEDRQDFISEIATFCDEGDDFSELKLQNKEAKSSLPSRERPMTVKEYLEVGSGYCPACGSQELQYEITELDGKEAWTNTTCKDCAVDWQTTWRLTGYTGVCLASPRVKISQDYSLRSAWDRALTKVFINEIGQFIPKLVSYFRARALQEHWVFQGADVGSSDESAINLLRNFPFALTHVEIPESKIYGLLVKDVVSDLIQLYVNDELEAPEISQQKDIIRRAGYSIVLTEPGSWQIEEISGLRLPVIFQVEEDAVKACYFLQLSIDIT